MANLYYDVRVDVSKSEVIDSGLRFTQGDSNVIFLRIAVTNGASKFDATDTTPSVNFAKPDGTFVVGTPVASGDVWTYQFLGNELQAAGRVLCDIKFKYSSGRVSSSKFAFFVEKDTTITGAAASQNYIVPMDAALEEMNNYKQQGYSMARDAELSAQDAEAWAVGQRGGEDVPNIDPTYENNSKYYAEQAKIYEESAAAIVGIGIATTTTAGIVKPDGTTITVDLDGTIHSAGGGPGGDVDWGDIGGTLSNQTDLQTALNGKQASLTTGDGIDITSNTIKVATTFSQASSRSNINSGDAFTTILGKIKKFFADIKGLAFIDTDGSSSTKFLRGDGRWTSISIPTVNNATLTIQKNGTNVQTFTANQSTDATANIEVDTWTSAVTCTTVGSDVVVVFDNLSDDYGYILCAIDADVSYTSVTKSTGTNTGTIKLTYVLDGATSGTTQFKLRILR